MSFEKEIIIFLQNFSTPFLDGVFVVLSYFFDWTIVVALSFILLLFKRYKETIYFLILEGVGFGVQTLLKSLINRPRPFVEYGEIKNIFEASSSSFPSGHSITCMMAVIILFIMIKDSKIKRKSICYALLGVALFLCLLNRMYLGQHFVSDVFGGFIIATIVAFPILKFGYYQKSEVKKA